MLIIGVDYYHPSFQQIAFLDQETGECGEPRLNHSDGEAEKFYRDLRQRGISVRVGMEATEYSRWFERLLAELGFELWFGDPAEIKAKRVRKQKTDRQDAQLLLKLLLEDRFPRVWVPSPENRDLRQLLWHRHRTMANEGQGLRTEVVVLSGLPCGYLCSFYTFLVFKTSMEFSSRCADSPFTHNSKRRFSNSQSARRSLS